ncbi:hypothetical protein K503DRAFT_318629 [Rhizopogon vinicolor AM-OR11-026]|uniref:Uncharacterized protein n=1 Tax=Rhizopogon vinicolor AM-OR11-026 TaxID=1314800 RepID=A0A1B7MUE4_9AGAM|nr:hypothetical protein K503DRAFT_318629 [Rhizopogon vinicolor AM-OR11-026]
MPRTAVGNLGNIDSGSRANRTENHVTVKLEHRYSCGHTKSTTYISAEEIFLVPTASIKFSHVFLSGQILGNFEQCCVPLLGSEALHSESSLRYFTTSSRL